MSDEVFSIPKDKYTKSKYTDARKELKLLGKRVLQLQKDKGELIDKNKELEDKLANADYQLEGRDNEIRELEERNANQAENLRVTMLEEEKKGKEIAELKAQIEKMKCCGMCKHYSMSFIPYWCTKNNTSPHCTSKCDKWELAND